MRFSITVRCGENVPALRHEADAGAGAAVGGSGGDVLAAEDHLAAGQFLHADDGFQQCGFTDAVAADQGNGAAFGDVHVDVP